MLSPFFLSRGPARKRFVAAAACLLPALPAWAQDSAPALPAITITGEKSARPIERTAPSVRVFGDTEIGSQPGWVGTNDLLEQTANITSSGTQNLAPAIRGIDGTGPAQGADAFLAGTRPRLNIQIDGRTASYNEVIFGDLGLWDVRRVEIFRGAQSTLQGRNALAGTVIYQTNDPSFEREIGFRAAVANHRQRQLSAVVSGPIVDEELAFRLALDGLRSQSFVNGFQGYPGIGDPGRFESKTARGKLLWKPQALPGFSTQLTLSHTNHAGPQTEAVARPFEARNSSYPSMPVFAPRANAGVLDTTWVLSDRVTFENRIVAGDALTRRYAMPGDGNATIRTRDLSIEPRLRFAPAQPGGWSGFAGLYAFRANQRDTIDLFGGGAWDDRTRTFAVYGEATKPLAEKLELTLGGRWERETRRRQGAMAMFTTDFDAAYNTFLPKATLSWHADPATTLGVTVSRGYNGGGAAFTYDAPFVNYSFKPEYAWTTEAFARRRALDGRLLLTANVFHSRYKDMQLPFDLNPDPAVWAYVVRNAPRAETYGAELGATWQATRALRLNGELGLLSTKVTRYPGSGVEGNELPRAPALSLVLGANWRHASGLELGASARYSAAYYSDITNVPRGRVEPGWLANARASYPVGSARLFAYVNNVFDSRRPVQLEADPNALTGAADVALLPRPRTVGVGLEVWF
jgi:outer membrane receptor protein involved in Fe transport